MTTLSDAVDGLLEMALVPSFTRVGADIRARLDHWTPVGKYDLAGRVVVITGGTSGLGLAAAQALIGDGATVVIVARDAGKAAAVVERICAAAPAGEAEFVVADMADLESVRAAAAEIARRRPRIDVLIHNAGALDAAFGLSPQGVERTAAAQVLGPFVLTDLLTEQLRLADRGRVIWMSSGGMYTQPLSVSALEMGPGDYDGTTAYARAKRAQVTLAEMWADRLRPEGIVVHSMHPGWADTPGVRKSLPTFRRVTGPLLRTVEQGADTMVWLAADQGAPLDSTGRFWLDRRPRAIHRLPSTRRADTPEERRRLWEWCASRAAQGDGAAAAGTADPPRSAP